MLKLIGDDSNEYGRRLFNEMPERFFTSWLKHLAGAYRLSVTGSLDYPEPEAHDLLGHIRRARAEEALATASADAGLTCISQLNGRKTSYHRVTVSPSIVMIQGYQANPSEPLRRADHRVDYASLTVGDLWDGFIDALAVPPEECTFVILQHGAHPKVPAQLAYARAQFPDANADRYVTFVDLMKRFGDPGQAAETRTPGALPLRPKQGGATAEEGA